MIINDLEIQYNGVLYFAVIKFSVVNTICNDFTFSCSNDDLPDDIAEFVVFARIDGEMTSCDWDGCDLNLAFKVVKTY